MSRFVQATCRYFLRVFGPGPGAQRGLVAADDAGEDDQRPDRLVRRGDRPRGAVQQAVHPPVAEGGCRTSTRGCPRTARPGRGASPSRTRTRPGSSARRSPCPARPPPPAGRPRRAAGRRRTAPRAGRAGWSAARASGRSVTWWEYLHPQVAGAGQVSAARAGALAGTAASVSSGCSFQARNAPGAPGCLPGLRFPRPPRASRSGGFFPGWSSVLGGIEEFPLLREISRSSRAILSACSAICAFSSAFSARSRAFASRSAATTSGASGVSGTPLLHHSTPVPLPSVIKSTPSARQRRIQSAPDNGS